MSEERPQYGPCVPIPRVVELLRSAALLAEHEDFTSAARLASDAALLLLVRAQEELRS